MLVQKSKDPDATLNYTFDWSAWLGSDTISTSDIIAEDGVTVSGKINTTTTATALISGGTVGQKYRITNRITTAAGLVNDKSFELVIEEH